MKSKYILSSLILFLAYFPYAVFAADCESMPDAFNKYECRIEQVCKIYDENKKVFNPEKYKPAHIYENFEISDVFLRSGRIEKPLKKAVSVYKENMNNIYKCSMIGIQKNSIMNIKKLLKLDKTWEIGKAIETKIDNILNRLDMVAESTKCLWIDKKTIFNKLSILRQTSYETCKFWFYTDYLKDYYKDPAKALGISEAQIKQNQQDEKIKNYTSQEVAWKMEWLNKAIDIELFQAYKVFPITFNAYSEYENNYPIHFLLELIKEDYMIFREKLYQMTNPINQVWYKIINAMKR